MYFRVILISIVMIVLLSLDKPTSDSLYLPIIEKKSYRIPLAEGETSNGFTQIKEI